MKPHSPVASRDPLGNLLREWRVAAELPPRFEERVWRRIGAEERRLREAGWWARFRSALEVLFARPAFATACLTVLLLTGIAAGRLQGQHEVARMDNTLGQRYVQLIDPYASPGR